MEGEGEVLFGSIPGPRGPQNLVFTCPPGFLGRGAHPDTSPNLHLCHSHPYGSHRGGVKVGEIQEGSHGAGIWHSPTKPPVAQRGTSRENAPRVPGG